MMPFFGLYPSRKTNSTISERLTAACVDLESLMNQLEPGIVISEHLSNLRQALFHSHTKVVQVAVKQFIRCANDRQLAEHLSEDMELVLGLIENLAHKELRVARDCVTVLLLLSGTPKALMHLLCPDITDVLKTIMTYVAVRMLVYEFIMQLSINSPLGLEKSHICGILEDIINDFKKKESYMTDVHHHQLHTLAGTSHGRSYLVKYGAVETVSKPCPEVVRDTMAHLITVVPTDVVNETKLSYHSAESEDGRFCLKKENSKQKSVEHSSRCHLSLSSCGSDTEGQPQPTSTCGVSATQPLLLEHLQHLTNSPSTASLIEKCPSTLREGQLTPSSSSLSSPCGSVDSSTIYRKPDDSKDILTDGISLADSSLNIIGQPWDTSKEISVSVLDKVVSNMCSVEPHELLMRHPHVLDAVLRAMQATDSDLVLLALQVLGYIGSTIEGKRLLYKQSKKEKFMSMVMRKLLSAIIHTSNEQRARAINIFYHFINVSESNTKYEKITRKWFRQMGRPQEIMKLIMVMCQQPPETTQVPAYRLLQSLCHQEWGQQYIRGRRGLIDLLLSVSHNESQAIRQEKNAALEALMESPSIGKVFKPQHIDSFQSCLSLIDLLLSVSHNESQAIRQEKNAALEALMESPSIGKVFKPQHIDSFQSCLSKYKDFTL